MSEGPTWYEILGVERTASPEQIKAAWRSATDKFEPGSGQSQFRLFNEAADVLLDPRRREAYDAQLGGSPAVQPRTPEPAPAPSPEPAAPVTPVTEPETDVVPEASASPGRSRLQTALLALVALALLIAAVFAALLVQRANDAGVGFLTGVTQGDAPARHQAGTAAGATAERALAAALSYDYRRMEADRKRALSFMTPDYGKEFADTFDKLLTAAEEGQPNNVVKTQTVVKASVLQVGVMNPTVAATDRVRILAYVNQSATKGTASPTVFQNRVAVTMVKRDGAWLIDGLTSY